MKSRRKNAGHLTHHQHYPHHAFEDQILRKAGIVCTVKVSATEISIRTKDYTEFLMAKAAISGMATVPIVRGLVI